MGTLPTVEIKTLGKEEPSPHSEETLDTEKSCRESSYGKSFTLDKSVVFIVAKDSFRYRIKYPANTLRYLQFYQVCSL